MVSRLTSGALYSPQYASAITVMQTLYMWDPIEGFCSLIRRVGDRAGAARDDGRRSELGKEERKRFTVVADDEGDGSG